MTIENERVITTVTKLEQVVEKLRRALVVSQREKFTGRLIFEVNLNQGGVSTAYVEQRSQIVK